MTTGALRPGWTRRVRAAAAAWCALTAVLLAVVAAPPASAGDPPLPVREVRDATPSSIARPDLVPYLGVVVEPCSAGLRIVRVVPGSPADLSRLAAGDVLRQVGDRKVATGDDLDTALDAFRPGDGVSVRASRGGKAFLASVRLSGRRPPDQIFRGSVFRLAVVPLRFADDVGAGPAPAALRRLIFATSGRVGPGTSLADYYAAQSFGRLAVEGDVLEPVTLASARAVYAGLPMGAADGSAFQEAANVLERRLGTAGLASYDGVAFVYGGAAETRAGRALWPHRSTVSAGSRRLPYYVHGTGADGGLAIGIHCHEFGHLLGLADAYGAGHRTGSGDFCLMAIGHRGGPRDGDARPFSLCVHCRTQLGWAEPVVVDPRVAQRIRLRPSDRGPEQAVLVPTDARCERYLLLEVRARRGSDEEIPSAGLLVWRVGGEPTPGQSVYAQPLDLVEAHGVDVFDASLVRPEEIAFPTARTRDLTPDTAPRVASASPACFPVHLTDMVREQDGSVTFTVGVPRRVRQAPPAPSDVGAPDAEGYVVRRDPVTGEDARFWVGPRERAPAGAVPAPSETGQERR